MKPLFIALVLCHVFAFGTGVYLVSDDPIQLNLSTYWQVFGFIYLTVYCVCHIALFSFHRWGKPLFVFTTVINLSSWLLLPKASLSTENNVEYLTYLEGMLAGGILAMLFLSDLRVLFQHHKSIATAKSTTASRAGVQKTDQIFNLTFPTSDFFLAIGSLFLFACFFFGVTEVDHTWKPIVAFAAFILFTVRVSTNMGRSLRFTDDALIVTSYRPTLNIPWNQFYAWRETMETGPWNIYKRTVPTFAGLTVTGTEIEVSANHCRVFFSDGSVYGGSISGSEYETITQLMRTKVREHRDLVTSTKSTPIQTPYELTLEAAQSMLHPNDQLTDLLVGYNIPAEKQKYAFDEFSEGRPIVLIETLNNVAFYLTAKTISSVQNDESLRVLYFDITGIELKRSYGEFSVVISGETTISASYPTVLAVARLLSAITDIPIHFGDVDLN